MRLTVLLVFVLVFGTVVGTYVDTFYPARIFIRREISLR